MPRMNGKALVERLENERPEMRVLFMSGYADNMIDTTGLLNRQIQFIAKPFDAPTLTARVRGVLDEKY